VLLLLLLPLQAPPPSPLTLKNNNRCSARTKAKVYAEGELIDCLDTVGKWCAARIVKLEGTFKALVHFEGVCVCVCVCVCVYVCSFGR
jgi:hypothetical protein